MKQLDFFEVLYGSSMSGSEGELSEQREDNKFYSDSSTNAVPVPYKSN